jgi:hypothetical protein
MSSRTVNVTILFVISLAFVSGVASLVVGTPSGRWMFWLHRVAALALLVLAWWKWRIVLRGYGKRGLTISTALSSAFTVLVVGSLLTGVLWATTGFPGLRAPILGSLTGLGVHIAVSVALLPLLLLHVVQRWQPARRVDVAGRRAAIRWAGLTVGGLALWSAGEAAARVGGLSGAHRRYSGSRERGSLRGNAFPTTNWFSDPKPRIDSATFTLRLTGNGVVRSLALADLLAMPQATSRATLDCTGGWFTTQDWTGVTLRKLLDATGVRVTGSSVVVRSATGYARRFPLDELDRLLLAIEVGGKPLTRGHGFPVRLVAPGYRGFEWVKWVVEIEVSNAPPWWQSPLPLQ